jgi:putative ABC transport system permease protein
MSVLTTLLFCLPPLLRVRKVRPLLILRRSVEPAGKQGGLGRLARAAGAGPELAAVAAILAGLALIAALLADSARVGVCFAAGLALTLLALLLLAQAALAGMRRMIRSGRPRLPSVLRHGIANLYRPGNQSAAVLAGLGTGVMLLLTVFLAQRAVLRAIERDQGPTLPNVFLVDISPAELGGLRAAVAAAPGVEAPLEVLPVLSGRILAVDGVEAGQLRLKNYPRRLLQSAVFTWSGGLPAGDTLEQGRWFGPDEGAVEVSRRVFERLHLHLGSRLRLECGEREIEVEVAGVFRTSGQHVYSRSEFVLPPQLLEGLPVIYYGALRIEPAEVPGLERTLFARYPTVTVINLADVLAAIESAVRQITGVVRFLAMFSMLAGVVILAMSIAGTRYRRMREAVVLKTLGAGRRYIVTVFSVEFLVLGLLAAAVGVIFAGLLTLALLHVLDVPGRPDVLSALVAIGTTALLAAATGWAASYGTLARKPLEILREQ